MNNTIALPPGVTAILSEIVTRQNHAKQIHDSITNELQSAVSVCLASIGVAPDWQLRIEQDGSMVAVAPENLT